jgi:hypothetical protein
MCCYSQTIFSRITSPPTLPSEVSNNKQPARAISLSLRHQNGDDERKIIICLPFIRPLTTEFSIMEWTHFVQTHSSEKCSVCFLTRHILGYSVAEVKSDVKHDHDVNTTDRLLSCFLKALLWSWRCSFIALSIQVNENIFIGTRTQRSFSELCRLFLWNNQLWSWRCSSTVLTFRATENIVTGIRTQDSFSGFWPLFL